MSRAALKLIMRELIARNDVRNGIIYLQVTRGVAPRDHKFPKAAEPALVMTTRQTKPQAPELVEHGVGVVTVPDIDRKSTRLNSSHSQQSRMPSSA